VTVNVYIAIVELEHVVLIMRIQHDIVRTQTLYKKTNEYSLYVNNWFL